VGAFPAGTVFFVMIPSILLQEKRFAEHGLFCQEKQQQRRIQKWKQV
jgi:hypothetical protein